MCADFFLTLTLFYHVYGSIIDFYYCSGAPEPTFIWMVVVNNYSRDDRWLHCSRSGLCLAPRYQPFQRLNVHTCNFLGSWIGSFRGDNFVGELLLLELSRFHFRRECPLSLQDMEEF